MRWGKWSATSPTPLLPARHRVPEPDRRTGRLRVAVSDEEPTFPGAVPPERARKLAVGPLELNLVEWGDPKAEPLVLCHGMFDHARAFDVLAPLLAVRYRVVAVDARGHGDSTWADAYRWHDDINDICAVVKSLERPVKLLGHSKGGGQATDATTRMPDLVKKLVNIDGFGPPSGFKFRGDTSEEVCKELGEFLRARRKASTAFRAASSLDALMKRRGRSNQRLSEPWLRYFVFHAARRSGDDWVWKADPTMSASFGPWNADWIAPAWRWVKPPMLAIVGTEPDFWGPASDDLLDERLELVQNVERVKVLGTGHFVHMERPEDTASLILDFLDA